jgi:hypothetical protein
MKRRTFLKGVGIATASVLAPLPRRAMAGRSYQRRVIRDYLPASRLIPYLTKDPAMKKTLRRLCRTHAYKDELAWTATLNHHHQVLEPLVKHLSKPHEHVAYLRDAQIRKLYQAALHREPTAEEVGVALLWLARTNDRRRQRVSSSLTFGPSTAAAQGVTIDVGGGPFGFAAITCCNPEAPESSFFGTPQFEATVAAIAAKGADQATAEAATAAFGAALSALGLGAEAIAIGYGIMGPGIASSAISFGFAGGSVAGGLAVISFVGVPMLALGVLGLYITYKIVEPSFRPPTQPPPALRPNDDPPTGGPAAPDAPPATPPDLDLGTGHDLSITITAPPQVTEPEATAPPDVPDDPDAPTTDAPAAPDASSAPDAGPDGPDGGGEE